MNCDCTERISALIDGELSTSETRELEEHLLTCRECQEAKAAFLSLRSEIVEFPVAYDPVAQREALARVIGKRKVTTTSRGLGWRWVFNPAVAACATLIIAGLVVAFIIYPKFKSAPGTKDQVAVNGGGPAPAGPTATPAPKEKPNGGNRNTSPKKSQPPASVDKNKTPSPVKKREPSFGPQPDFITQRPPSTEPVRSADAETMTAIHLQKSELLLRSFRNVRMNERGALAEVGYEKKRAQQLVYQNMMLRREADISGDVQVAGLLESLEPILIDIANLPDKPAPAQVRVIKDRVERKNIVALLQVNSTALARALD